MKALKITGLVILLAVIGTQVTGYGYIWGGIQETYLRGWKNSNIDDIEFRDLRTIESADSAHAWISKPVWGMDFTEEERKWHEEYMSASFLVLHGDTLLFERYMQGFDERTVSNSFSACKSIVALATGLAVTQGLGQCRRRIGGLHPTIQRRRRQRLDRERKFFKCAPTLRLERIIAIHLGSWRRPTTERI